MARPLGIRPRLSRVLVGMRLLSSLLLALLLPTAALPSHGASLPAAAVAGPESVLDDRAFTQPLEEALDALYDLRFEAAEPLLTRLADAHPGHPAEPLLRGLPAYFRILLDETDTTYDEAFLGGVQEALRRAEARIAADPADVDGRFFQAAAYAFRGRVRILRGAFVPAAHDGKRALQLVREIAELRPDLEEVAFGLGAWDYAADVFPGEYPILKPLKPFFPGGDRKRGLARLERAMNDGGFTRTEAVWFLLQVHHWFEDDRDRTVGYARWLLEQHPANPLFHELAGRVHLRYGECDRVREIFTDVLEKTERGEPGYNHWRNARAHYSLGRCDLQAGDGERALAHLTRVEAQLLRRAPDSALRTLALLRRGQAFDLLGRRREALVAYGRVLERSDTSGAHAKARGFLGSPYRLEPTEAAAADAGGS